jgi:hypothetical protein
MSNINQQHVFLGQNNMCSEAPALTDAGFTLRGRGGGGKRFIAFAINVFRLICFCSYIQLAAGWFSFGREAV